MTWSCARASRRTVWGIQQLYLNTVPRLAQQAEMLPHIHHSGTARGYVMEEDGEVMAYLEIRRGSSGALFNTIVHPQAEQHARDIVAQGLRLVGPALVTAGVLLCAAIPGMAVESARVTRL